MMNKCYSIGDLMSMYYEREFAAVEQMPITKLSSKHNRKMIKAFRIFAENRMSINNQPMKTVTGRQISLRKRIILAVIIVVLLAFVTGSVIVFVSSGFRGTVYNDNTRIFAFDVGGSPSVIEEQFMLSVVPEGFELCEYEANDIYVYSLYKNSENQTLAFQQTVKSKFHPHINTEGYDLQETKINSCNAIYIEYINAYGVSSTVIWDNEDYILELFGNFDNNELRDLAISNEINGF